MLEFFSFEKKNQSLNTLKIIKYKDKIIKVKKGNHAHTFKFENHCNIMKKETHLGHCSLKQQ